MRHADIVREATAAIAKAASALLYDTRYRLVVPGKGVGAYRLVLPGRGVGACGGVFCGGMGEAMGSKNRCKTFSTESFDGRIQSQKSSFSTGSAGGNSQSKKVESKKPFFDCKKARFGLQSKEAVFD